LTKWYCPCGRLRATFPHLRFEDVSDWAASLVDLTCPCCGQLPRPVPPSPDVVNANA